MRVISSGGGFHIRRPLHERHRRGGVPRQFGARRAGFQMALHLGLAVRRERAVHVIADQFFQFCAVHTTSFCFRSRRASSARPRLILLFTVPSGMSSTSAISRYSISCKSRKITASRKSGESFCRVACRISLASRPASAWSGRDRRRPTRLFQHRKLFLDRIRHPLLTCTAIMVDQQVTRHPRQPRVKAAFRAAEALNRLENPQEHFLRQVLRFLRAVRKTETQAVHLPRVLPDKFLPGGFVAVQASGNEGLVQAVGQNSASGNIQHRAGSPTARGVSSKLLPS